VLVMELAESTVNIRVRWWINPPRRADALDSRDKVLTAIKKKLTANGIDLPFPTQQILFHDQTEETDGIALVSVRDGQRGTRKYRNHAALVAH
jgi:small-conductance mechanosensitive channel